MIKLEGVQKQYGEFHLDCTMEVKRGCITGLIGKNGAGKTTVFKSVLGLIHRDSGRIEVLGRAPEDLTAADRERMGVVLADSGFSGYLRVKDLLPMLQRLYPAFGRQAFEAQCRHFSIPMDKKIKEFSTGMKRKLQVAAALSHEADLLILDEPTAGLDVVARDELLDALREYMEKDGRAVLISSHISTDLENLCDDIYMIHDGKMVLHEETDVLLSDYAVLKMTKEQYQSLDRSGILRIRQEDYGYCALTDQKQFYLENYPHLAVEKSSIDEIILMMIRGERYDGNAD